MSTSARTASRVLLGDVLLPGGVRVDLDLEAIPTNAPGTEVVVMGKGGRPISRRTVVDTETIAAGVACSTIRTARRSSRSARSASRVGSATRASRSASPTDLATASR